MNAIFLFFCGLQLINSTYNDGTKVVPNKEGIIRGNVESSLSRSGKFLATLCEDGTIAVWNVETQKKIVQCRPHESLKLSGKEDFIYFGPGAEGICFCSNNDEILYFGTYLGIYMWRWSESKSPKQIYSELGRMGRKLVCSENGEWLSSINGRGNICCVNLKSLKDPIVYRSGRSLPDRWKNHLFFTPNSLELVFHDNSVIKSLSFDSGKVNFENLGKIDTESPIDMLVRNQAGKSIVAGTQSGEMYIMDTATKKMELFSKGHDYTPIASFSPDGKFLVVGDGKGIISVFEIESKLKLYQAQGPKSGVTGIGFLHDNQTIFAIGEYRHVRYWRMDKTQLNEITKEPNP